MTLKYYFDIERGEFMRANWIASRRALARTIGIAGCCWLVLMAAFALEGDSRSWIMEMFGALFIFWVPLVLWLWRRNVRARFAGTPSIGEEQSYEFDEAGIKTQNTLSKHEYTWAAVIRASETTEFFFFYITKKLALFLPKRVLQSDAQAGLRALVSEEMNRLGRSFTMVAK